jgi:hypothetical protein
MENNNTALNGVKKMIADGIVTQEAAEKYFPELKESEDERIKKELILFFTERAKHTEDSTFNGLSSKEIIAWLEKQGEQKPDESKGMNLVEEKMTPFQREVFGIIDLDIENEQGLKQVCDKLLTLASNEIKLKSAEWSDEDKEYLRRAINAMKDTHPKTTDWLKSIKERVACEANYTTAKQWKPSDEQIKAVKEAACYSSVFSEKTIDNLILLSKQLKKLREE